MKVLCYTITRWRKRNAAYTKGWKRSMSEKVIMLGNEAIARGAYEAGVKVSAAYPGTPSTEISENLVKYKDSLYCEWSPNEKSCDRSSDRCICSRGTCDVLYEARWI